MIKRILIFLLGVCIPGIIAGQSSFSISPELVIAEKPATNFVFYNYTQFENHTNDTLYMRWVRTSTIIQDINGNPGGGDFGDWSIAIQDPNTFYNPAIGLDSADFFLPPVTGSTDKFILQIFPNLQPGYLTMTFDFFPINDPSDVQTVQFEYTVTAVPTSVQELYEKNLFAVFPNPVQKSFQIENQDRLDFPSQLISPDGKVVRKWESYQEHYSIEGVLPGTYFLSIQVKGKQIIRSIIIQ